jgi:hypothetical protein
MSGCEEVREILLSVARGEIVTAGGQRFLREHVEACPQCRRRLANERMLTAGLSAVASGLAGDPPPAVRAALMQEFRRQRAVTPIHRPVMRWVAAGAVAAALLLALFGLKGRRQEPVIAPTQVLVATVKPAPVAPTVVPVEPARVPSPLVQAPAVQAKVVHPYSGRPKAHPTSTKAHRVSTVEKPVEAPAEVATDFFEIPYVEPLRPDERADVFRIQMPRANMAVFGLPVTGGRLDSRVTADVLAGEDGVVRAVRFIR